MMNILTPDAINRMCAGDTDLRPILQVMDIRQIGTNPTCTVERFRLLLSDGVLVQLAMLATQMNEMIKSRALIKGSIVQVTEYIVNTVQNRQILIILNMEIRQTEATMIGNPEPRLGGSVASAEALQQQQQGMRNLTGLVSGCSL